MNQLQCKSVGISVMLHKCTCTFNLKIKNMNIFQLATAASSNEESTNQISEF